MSDWIGILEVYAYTDVALAILLSLPTFTTMSPTSFQVTSIRLVEATSKLKLAYRRVHPTPKLS